VKRATGKSGLKGGLKAIQGKGRWSREGRTEELETKPEVTLHGEAGEEAGEIGL
jgi:hypothetical protein